MTPPRGSNQSPDMGPQWLSRRALWIAGLASFAVISPATLARGQIEASSTEAPPSETLKGYKESQERAQRLAAGSLQHNQLPSWSLVGGLGFRGTRSESRRFEDSLGLEAGLGMPLAHGVDFVLGAGEILKPGSGVNFEVVARAFLWSTNSGPYVGAGWRTGGLRASEGTESLAFATLGLFGGEGLYVEFDFRASRSRPLAAILEWGIRLRGEREKPDEADPKGPLVMAPHPRITWAAR